MKRLLPFLALLVASSLFAADAANDVILFQRNAANDDNVQRNITSTTNALIVLNGAGAPTSTLTPSGLTSLGVSGTAPATSTTTGTVIIGDGSSGGLGVGGAIFGGSNLSLGTTATINLSATAGNNPQLKLLDADASPGFTQFGLSASQIAWLTPGGSAAGGLAFYGMSDASATAITFIGGLGSATPSVSIPAITFVGSKKSGSNFAALAATELLLEIGTGAASPTTSVFTMFGNGNSNFKSTTEATTGGAGAVITAGGFYAAKKIVGNSDLIIAGTVIHTLSATPASASATGTVGTISWDSSFIYICVATNTWKRVAIATW